MNWTVFPGRRAGVLLHPSSLPGGPGNGDIGPDAYRFVDFLQRAGIGVWQTLPLGPTHADRSPYQCLSVHAGNPLFINGDKLRDRGWIEAQDLPSPDCLDPARCRLEMLAKARLGFMRHASPREHAALEEFSATHAHWLEDYALYQALRHTHGHRPWVEWPAALRDRDSAALDTARKALSEKLAQARFEQFLFFTQWGELKAYANSRGVHMFGDLPIFVAHDSAEVWAQRRYFRLDDRGQPTVVAGVPPDYFSATGQRWGNPLYDWVQMGADNFRWWQERIASQMELFDLMRIDHFRGFEATWEIPADQETAIGGSWVNVPGDALFQTLQQTFGTLPLVAEDLGLITEAVNELRRRFDLPGMKVLQFAFDGGPGNPYLLHNHDPSSVVYTGTHDNDTTLGWFDALPKDSQEVVLDYLGQPCEPMPWPLIRSALVSVARLAIVPLQDFLELGSEHRMNKPGTNRDNWVWRYQWAQVPEGLPERLRHLNWIYGRAPSPG